MQMPFDIQFLGPFQLCGGRITGRTILFPLMNLPTLHVLENIIRTYSAIFFDHSLIKIILVIAGMKLPVLFLSSSLLKYIIWFFKYSINYFQ